MEKEFFTELKKNCNIHGIDIDIICDDRRKVLKIINSFESFIEDMPEEDLGVLIAYIKNTYD